MFDPYAQPWGGKKGDPQTSFQYCYGTIALRSGTAGVIAAYLGAAGNSFPALSYNASPTGTAANYVRTINDVASIFGLGSLYTSGRAFEWHYFATGNPGDSLTCSATSLAGYIDSTGALTWNKAIAGATKNDSTTGVQTYDPYTPFAGNVLYFNGASTVTLRGLAVPAAEGTYVYIANNTGNNMTIKNQFNGNSADFVNTTSADITVSNTQGVMYVYIGSRWRGIKAS